MKLVDLIGNDAFKAGVLSSRVAPGKDESYILTQSGLSNKFISKNYCDQVDVNMSKVSKYVSVKGDLVLKNVGDYLISYLMDDDIILPSFVHILRIEDEFIRRFVFMKLSSKDFIKFIAKKNGDELIKRISLNDLKEYELGEFSHPQHMLSNLFFKHEQLEMLYCDLSKYLELKKQFFIEVGGKNNE